MAQKNRGKAVFTWISPIAHAFLKLEAAGVHRKVGPHVTAILENYAKRKMRANERKIDSRQQ